MIEAIMETEVKPYFKKPPKLTLMRYEYTVTKESGEAEIIKAMSWKKLVKSLLLKYEKFSGWCTYR